jgi:hypothetical protein
MPSFGAVILSGDVSDDGVECDGDYVEETEGDSECAEDATADDYSCAEVDATDSCLHRKGQEEVGQESSTHIRRRWKNILTKLPWVIS